MKRFLHHPFVRKHICQACKFAICGSIGASIDLGSLTLLVELFDIAPQVAIVPSTLLAVIFVFLANKHFTFKNKERKYLRQALKFSLVYGAAICFNIGISWFFLWLGVHYFLAKVLAIGIVAAWNYVLSHGFVFRKTEEVDAAVF